MKTVSEVKGPENRQQLSHCIYSILYNLQNNAKRFPSILSTTGIPALTIRRIKKMEIIYYFMHTDADNKLFYSTYSLRQCFRYDSLHVPDTYHSLLIFHCLHAKCLRGFVQINTIQKRTFYTIAGIYFTGPAFVIRILPLDKFADLQLAFAFYLYPILHHLLLLLVMNITTLEIE